MSITLCNNNTLPVRIGLTSAVEAAQAVVTEMDRATAAEGVIAGNLANEVNRATVAESALQTELRAGRVYTMTGGSSPSGLVVPADYSVDLIGMQDGAAGTVSWWRRYVLTPQPTEETDTLKQDAGGVWWQRRDDLAVGLVAAEEARATAAEGALQTEMREGRVYTMSGSSPSGQTIPVDYSVDLLAMQQRSTNTMTYWRRLTTAPDPAVETETVKLDAGGTWWTLVADPAISAEIASVSTIIDELSSRIPHGSAASSITPIAAIGGDLVLAHDGDGIDFRPSPRLRSELVGAIDGKVLSGDFSTTIPLLTAGGDILLAHDGDGIDFIPSPVLKDRLSSVPSFFGRERLARLRAKIAALRQATAGERLRVLLVGDSWVMLNSLRAGLIEVLTRDYPLCGEGWISANPSYSLITGATYTESGWSIIDGTSVTMPYGYTPDGQCIWTDQQTATISLSNITCTRLSIYVRENGGRWRYRADGGAWTEVIDDAGGALKMVQISGLSDAAHTIEIDTTGNAGVVAVAGFYMARDGAAGIEISRFGDGGATALNHLGYLEAQTQVLHDEPPDLIITVLGTNDARVTTSPPSTYVEYMSGLLAAARVVRPDVSVIHLIPPNNALSVVRPTTDYRDAIYANRDTLGSAYLSLTEYYLPFSQALSLGLWDDSVHPSLRGGRMIADLLNDLLIGI